MVINEKILFKAELPVEQFILLQAITEQNESVINFYKKLNKFESICKILETSNYIKIGLFGPEIREVTYNLFNFSSAETWIEEWRNLFPAGVNSSGFRYRGNRGMCLKNMNSFLKQYKFDKDTVFKATKKYINRFSLNKNYMMQAHYFIKKDGGSTLHEECLSSNELISSDKFNDRI